MNTPLLGLPFFIYNKIDLLTSNGLLQLPNMTYQFNTMRKPLTKECPEKVKQAGKTIGLFVRKKTVLKPYMMDVLECKPPEDWKGVNLTGVIEPMKALEKELNVCITNAICTLENDTLAVGIMNLNETDFTIPEGLKIANLHIMSFDQAKILVPVDPNLCRYLERTFPGETENFLNQLYRGPTEFTSTPKFWFPTPEDDVEVDKLNKLERRIYDEIVKLKQAEELDLTSSTEHRELFLSNSNWDGSVLNRDEKRQVELLLVKYHDIFARHRMDVGINTEFKMKLQPEHHKPIYSQSLPTPINLKEDLTVELALMQYYGLITTLPYSRYSSPIFAQKKSNGKMRILIDLRRIDD